MIITMIGKQQIIRAVGLAVFGLLTGCSWLPQQNDQDDLSAVSVPPLQVDSRKTCGNEPSYSLNGKTYQVLSTASTYVEEGLATWYGAEYQGTETAGCERFDMNAFSAAHRTLPLPSFVRVTHLGNGRSVIVRVNDRGPFDNKGLIQLSFAAANALGMTGGKGGVAKVRIEGLDEQGQSSLSVARPPVAVATSPQATLPPKRKKRLTPAQAREIERAKQSGTSFYVVIDNYETQEDALDMFVRLTSVGLSKTEMATAVLKGRTLHQVRIGPLYVQDQIDNVKDTLESNGLATFRVVEVEQ